MRHEFNEFSNVINFHPNMLNNYFIEGKKRKIAPNQYHWKFQQFTFYVYCIHNILSTIFTCKYVCCMINEITSGREMMKLDVDAVAIPPKTIYDISSAYAR